MRKLFSLIRVIGARPLGRSNARRLVAHRSRPTSSNSERLCSLKAALLSPGGRGTTYPHPMLRILAFSTISGLCFVSTAWSAGFTAGLDRDTIALGETATLSLSFADVKPQGIPTPPEIPGLQIDYSRNSERISIVQGQSS